MASRPRILIASPHVGETPMLADWIRSEGFEPLPLLNLSRVAEQIRDSSFDLFMSDFTFACKSEPQPMAQVRARNAKTPIIVIGETDPVAESQALIRNAMYLTRPLERTSVACTVAMAVMETRPTRRSLRKPVNRFDAIVEGVPSHIIDISPEGLRLEIPRSRRAAPPPPHFTVRVPMLAVALSVRRMWASGGPSGEAAWYGGELAGNTRAVEQAWRVLVDAIPSASAAIELH